MHLHAHHRDPSSPLVIYSEELARGERTNHVLGKALAQSNVVALLNKVARRKSILVGVTGSEALVSHVEESEVLLLLDHITDLTPLFRGWVNTSRVMSASMQQDNAALGSGLQVLDKTLKVQSNGILVIVTVLSNLKTRVAEDSIVVGPGRGREKDLLGAGVETLEESTTDSEGAGTGDGLCDGDTTVFEGSRVGAVGEFGSFGGKVANAGDGGIFLVLTRCDDLVFGGTHGRKNVGLALVV
ncbi:hypothetical protein TMatcc_000161, partial [Talaromyces marneffei ATCC 18224]